MMRAKLILADAATPHPDGTISMLRAGINHVASDKLPVVLKASLVVRIECEPDDTGQHIVELLCVDSDGQQIMPPHKSQIDVAEGASVHNIIMGLQVKFEQPGPYSFIVRVDDQDRDSWAVVVVHKKRD